MDFDVTVPRESERDKHCRISRVESKERSRQHTRDLTENRLTGWECTGKKEAELGVMKLQGPRENAKDCWQPPETRREAWNRFSICEPKQMLIHTYGLNERLINVCF